MTATATTFAGDRDDSKHYDDERTQRGGKDDDSYRGDDKPTARTTTGTATTTTARTTATARTTGQPRGRRSPGEDGAARTARTTHAAAVAVAVAVARTARTVPAVAAVPEAGGSRGPGGPGGGARGCPGPLCRPSSSLAVSGSCTLLGWSSPPPPTCKASGASLDPAGHLAPSSDARHHNTPGTRWCITLTGPARHRRHRTRLRPRPAPLDPRTARRIQTQPPTAPRHQDHHHPRHHHRRHHHPRHHHRGPPGPPGPSGPRPGPRPQELAAFLRALSITLTPIARGENVRPQPARRPLHPPAAPCSTWIRARTARCIAPWLHHPRSPTCDLDHTTPWPDGPTDQCNLAPPCRHHHRVKQAPGWTLNQPQPGIMGWTTPAGRTYTTTPTIYDT